ncbi:MAG: hypothetical protein HY908_08895 [Myxococcales bacterium]|nr:hypothetical protein [Myxococcales bacterium]
MLTQELPAHLPHARRVLGDICFVSGQRYAGHFRRLFALAGERGADPAALAIEVLRTSEYLYRVNPEHWGGTDAAARTGYLEGTACPWYTEPGWEAGHCGIFGRFQAGVCAEFGLGYALTSTIPKHGGATCRVDLKPLPAERLRRPKAAALST